MASLTEEIADALARDAIRAAEELGDENLVTEISRLIGASSTTTQEAFNTAVRVRQSEARARRLLADRLGASWPLDAVRAAPAQVALPAPVAQASELQVTASQPVAAAPQSVAPTASQPSAQARSSAQGVGSALPPTTAAAAKPAAPQLSATPAGQVPSAAPAAKAPSTASTGQALAGQAVSAPVRAADMPGRTASVPRSADSAVARAAPEPRPAAPDARQAVPASPTRQETAPPRSPAAPRLDLAPPAGPTPTRPPGLSEEAAPPPLAGPVPARPPKPEFHPIEAPAPASPAQSFAAKLALASALPRRTATPAEPRNPLLPNPDDEVPDGDWG